MRMFIVLLSMAFTLNSYSQTKGDVARGYVGNYGSGNAQDAIQSAAAQAQSLRAAMISGTMTKGDVGRMDQLIATINSLYAVIGGPVQQYAPPITLFPGQSVVARSGEQISCQAGVQPPSYPPAGGPACVISYVNNAYHVYSIDPQTGRDNVLGWYSSPSEAISMLQTFMTTNSCAPQYYNAPRCRTGFANNAYHLYIDGPNGKTYVAYYDSNLNTVATYIQTLKQLGVCQ